MSTTDERMAAPAPAQPGESNPRRSDPALALVRNSWRQLTSMRTALILLFLLAVGAIPGSMLPQRSINIEKVDAYLRGHPDLGPVLDRIGAFDVYSSVWFSAIYVLLFTSLIGCVLPRLRDHARALRAVPPDTPKRLDRLPEHAVLHEHDGDLAAIAALLRKRRWRVVVREGRVSAEKGYLKETGNLLFHVSLLAMLLGVGIGSWYGWHGNRLLVAGADHAFCNNLQQYDESGLGPRVDGRDLPPFCLELTDFRAIFRESGQPESFSAAVTVDEAGKRPRSERFSVNSPLRLDGANVYLLGHGYAPVIRYTDRYGSTQTSMAPFLNEDSNLTSEGLALFPDANVDPATGKHDPHLQVAFEGIYLPTAPDSPPFTHSVYPAERSPALLLIPYRGDLGLDIGIPGSVYKLDQHQLSTGKLKRVGMGKLLRVGQKWTLDDGTTVEFLGTRPYAALSVRYAPGSTVMLASAGLLLIGLMLSLTGHRRRVWFRASPVNESTTGGSSLLEAGGLPRADYPGFADEFSELLAAVRGDGHSDDGHSEDGRVEGTD